MTKQRIWFIFILLVAFVVVITLALQITANESGEVPYQDNFAVSDESADTVVKTEESELAPPEEKIENVTVGDGCYVAGCSNQVCTDDLNLTTTCEWHETYACYNNATCERQPDGECGWTRTEEIMACLSAQIPDLDIYVNNR